MFLRRPRNRIEITTARLVMRPPMLRDHEEWATLRRESREFLAPWEPGWSCGHLSRRAFRNRVVWSDRAIRRGEAMPLLLTSGQTGEILGGLTLSNIRRQPAQAGTLGYWVGEIHAGRGYMTEALSAFRDYAFASLDLSRLEAACLPENTASPRPPQRCRLKPAGVAPAYLQINGRWRDHVCYAALREDRRGCAAGDASAI